MCEIFEILDLVIIKMHSCFQKSAVVSIVNDLSKIVFSSVQISANTHEKSKSW